MTLQLLVVLLVVFPALVEAAAFNFPTIPDIFGGKTSSSSSSSNPVFSSFNVGQIKSALLEAVSGTQNGKEATPEQQRKILGIVAALEKDAKIPILSNPKDLQRLDGTWYLQYTSPSTLKGEKDDGDELEEFEATWIPEFAKEGDSNIETRPFQSKGTISAAGIPLATESGLTKQTFDVKNLMVVNNITNPNNGIGIVVGGPFRPSPNVPNRGIVSFSKADISLNSKVLLRLGWVFNVLALLDGSKDNGWLETTYLDDELRIGRGNKGTMFVFPLLYDHDIMVRYTHG